MIRSAALTGVFLSLLLIGGAYASTFVSGGAAWWAPWAMAIGTSAMLVALMALGAARRNRLGVLWIPLAFTFILLAGGFCLALAMPPEVPGSALWLGLPPRAAVILYGVGILPFLIIPAAYALTFDELTLSEADIRRVGESIASRAAAADVGDEGRA